MIADGAIDCPLNLNFTEAVTCQDDLDPMDLATDHQTPTVTNPMDVVKEDADENSGGAPADDAGGAPTGDAKEDVDENTGGSSAWSLSPVICVGLLMAELTLSSQNLIH